MFITCVHPPPNPVSQEEDGAVLAIGSISRHLIKVRGKEKQNNQSERKIMSFVVFFNINILNIHLIELFFSYFFAFKEGAIAD